MKRQTGGSSGAEELQTTGGGSGGGGTVDQGTGGSSPWLVEIDPAALPIPVDPGPTTLPPDAATFSEQLLQSADLDQIRIILARLEKLEDGAHVSGDSGFQALAVRKDDDIAPPLAANGDYIPITTNAAGRQRVSINSFAIIDAFDSTTGWSALDNNVANLSVSLNHVLGSGSLKFDKVNGSINTTYAIIQKTITSVNLYTLASGAVFFQGVVWVPNLANTTNIILRLGTDSSNYNEWAVPTTGMTAGTWQQVRFAAIESIGSIGNGWDSTNVTYIAVGVQFDTEARLLADILWDALSIVSGAVTDAVLQTSTQVNTANVNLNRINGVTPATSTGTVNTGSLRVNLATDVALPTGTNNLGFARDGAQAAVANTWNGVHVPATAVQATKTQASAGTGKRNVCTGFTATICSNGTAPVPTTPVTIKIIDGASGGGIILWQTNVNMPAVAGGIVSFVRSGIWLVGSQATAMTIEFSAAGPTNTYESVAFDGVIITE